MDWITINKRKPKSFCDVLLKGMKYDKQVVIIGYYHKKENRFITAPIGWNAEFIEWQPLPS